MELHKLIVENFGVYRGRHEILLSSPSQGKPIILFGGLNGGGKTTLLDAVQLALYGKLARCSNRGTRAYLDYLTRFVHKGVDLAEGASITLEFRQPLPGEGHTYRIERRWSDSGRGIQEQISVWTDDTPDYVLTESWTEFMEDLLPVRIAPLFFFDGEKIEGFADSRSSAELLSTAVQSLLGLDIVDNLSADLAKLEGRNQTRIERSDDRGESAALIQKRDALTQEHTRLFQERAGIQNEIDTARKDLASVEQRFRSEGGELFERRSELETQRKHLSERLERENAGLSELAHGMAPLALVTGMLDVIQVQAQKERTAREAKAIAGLLGKRDAQLTRHLKENGLDASTVAAVQGYLEQDRENRRKKSRIDSYLMLDEECETLLSSVQGRRLSEAVDKSRKQLAEVEHLASGLDNVTRLIASIPNEEVIADLLAQREDLKTRIAEAERRAQLVDSDLARAQREKEQLEAASRRALERIVHSDLEQKDASRLITHSGRVRETLGQFRLRVLQRHVQRIGQLILESYRELLHKKSLVDGLQIEPATFAIRLTDPNGRKVAPDRLSAGERQLLAVAILWGLAKASGRRLPIVIDTPMGRLDSAHRSNLVERYFPAVSHQVLLLSTDEEVDQRFFDKLSPKIGRSYRLDYSNTNGATEVKQGYFWETLA